MTESEQVTVFGRELRRLIDRFADEYDLSYAAIVGALVLIAMELGRELESIDDD